MWTFFSLYTGDAETVTVIRDAPAATAISAPRRFGTSTHQLVPSSGSWATISAAPAMEGTARGRNERCGLDVADAG